MQACQVSRKENHTYIVRCDNKMPFVNIKKQYIAMGMLIFILLFFFNSKPTFQCQLTADVTTYLPTIYGVTPTYARLAQKADLTR